MVGLAEFIASMVALCALLTLMFAVIVLWATALWLALQLVKWLFSKLGDLLCWALLRGIA